MKHNGRAQSSAAALHLSTRHEHAPSHTPALAKRLYTALEAGIYLGFKSAWPVRELAWKGELPTVKIGTRRIAFDVQDLDYYIDSQKTREQIH